MTHPIVDPVLPLTLRVEGPVISQDSAAPVFGLDTVALMDDGKAILPGSQIKGLLREVFALAIDEGAPGLCSDWLSRWFGTESGAITDTTATSYEPATGRLFLTDLTAKPTRKDLAITRVAVDDERGGVQEGMLQVIEAPWGYGDIAEFAGQVRVLGKIDTATLDRLRDRLEWAFKLIPAVGAFKTAGFGRLLSAELGRWTPLSPRKSEAGEAPGVADAIDGRRVTVDDIIEAGGVDFVLHPTEPFVVWPVSFGGNFFAGDATIPGQVLKAVTARWLGDRGLLDGQEENDALAGLVFRHARPVPEHVPDAPRPAEIPLSVYCGVKVNADKPKDKDIDGDALLDGAEEFDYYSGEYAMAFQPDWKGVPAGLAQAYGHGEQPGRVTRTRTAIDAEGVAEDEQLFTHAAVDPKGFVWRAPVLIPPGADRRLARKMAGLLANLDGTSLGLGKTKAPLVWTPRLLDFKPPAAPPGAVWRVVLQTPACLHGPAKTCSTHEDPMAALRQDYEAYWKGVLGNDVRLVDFMARQRLAGGYLARRHPVAPTVGFEPYLLTEPGSIFVLATPNGASASKIRRKLEEVAVVGLPLSNRWPAGQRDWRKHPFLPDAGWGEVRISGEDPLKPELSRRESPS